MKNIKKFNDFKIEESILSNLFKRDNKGESCKEIVHTKNEYDNLLKEIRSKKEPIPEYIKILKYMQREKFDFFGTTYTGDKRNASYDDVDTMEIRAGLMYPSDTDGYIILYSDNNYYLFYRRGNIHRCYLGKDTKDIIECLKENFVK